VRRGGGAHVSETVRAEDEDGVFGRKRRSGHIRVRGNEWAERRVAERARDCELALHAKHPARVPHEAPRQRLHARPLLRAQPRAQRCSALRSAALRPAPPAAQPARKRGVAWRGAARRGGAGTSGRVGRWGRVSARVSGSPSARTPTMKARESPTLASVSVHRAPEPSPRAPPFLGGARCSAATTAAADAPVRRLARVRGRRVLRAGRPGCARRQPPRARRLIENIDLKTEIYHSGAHTCRRPSSLAASQQPRV